jgi:putative peptidoglycan lipid II flippase
MPNLFRDLFAEGALSAAFVSVFSRYISSGDEKEAWRLASLVLNTLLLILTVLTLLGILFSPFLVNLMAPGFKSIPGKTDLTIKLTRTMFPFLILIALAALSMGILNSKDRFAIPAFASSFFNLGSIIGGLFFAYIIDPSFGPLSIVGMAIGVLIGGTLQVLIQIPSLIKVGFRYRLISNFSDPGLRQILILMGPSVIGAAAVQVNVLVNNFFASYLDNGAVSWLNYAFRFMHFPIGVFGVAIGTATLPSIARSAGENNIDQFRKTLSSSLGLVFLLSIPSACGLAILGKPIISLIYQRGSFLEYDTIMTSTALAYYSIGLFGYAAIKVMAPAFYALKDAKTPMYISLFSILTNLVLSFFLVKILGHRGLALSTAMVALGNFLLLFIFMRKKIGWIDGTRILDSFLKISIASIFMSIGCFISSRIVSIFLGHSSLFAQFTQVAVPIIISIIILFTVCKLLKVYELEMVMGIFNKKKS